MHITGGESVDLNPRRPKVLSLSGRAPTNRSTFVGWRASAINLTRPSLQTGGSGASRTLTSRRTARFERGGLTKCPALPNKLAVMRGFEPLGPGFNRATGFPDQLFKPLTHITAKQTGGKYSIRTNDTDKVFRVSSAAP